MGYVGRRIFDQKDTLCWHCKKSGGLCSWSHNLTPVKGWEAVKDYHMADGKKVSSYKVISCPEFVEG